MQTKVIEPVRYSGWAAPIVPVLKSDVEVRVCGDNKLMVNRVSLPFGAISNSHVGLPLRKMDRRETIHETPIRNFRWMRN